MSDIRKWLKIMESVPAIFPDQDPKHALIKQDATVMISPSVGGGAARYMNSTPDGAMVDIKGIARELSQDDFSLPERDYEDGYQKGNDWFHMNVNPDTPGTMNDKPEFRAGDMVKVADVYGTVIGPGMGVFIAYGTTGQDCIISFDNKKIVVPVANIAAALEQNAKDNFDQMDNDGNLSPMSFGSQNRKEEPAMDQRDEFSRWIGAVEEALRNEDKPEIVESKPNQCNCGSWNCPVCFPDEEDKKKSEMELLGAPLIGEEDNKFVEKPKSGKGVKLGDIVTKTEVRPTAGHNSPETYGGDNLLAQPRPPRTRDDVEPARSELNPEHSPLTDVEEEIPIDAGDDNMDYDDGLMDAEVEMSDEDDGLMDANTDPFAQDDMTVSQIGDEEDEFQDEETIQKILNIQEMGFSKDDKHYSRQELLNYTPEELKGCYDRVMGDVTETPSDIAEPPDRPRPTKTKIQQVDPFADMGDDILNPRQADLPAEIPGDEPRGVSGGSMSLPSASRADTQRRVSSITPTDQMRDFMNRINPMAGGDEPELEPTPGNELTVRTAADVPAVINSALQASGTQNPLWHTVDNLPGYMQRNIRGMGRQIFGMFTSTPLENIQTLANVNGQGPNTDAEMRSVAGWLRDNAEDLGRIDVSHGMAIPGYQPDVKEYRANGIRFQIVRDPMGQYIYAYPDADARLGGPPGAGGGQLPGQGGGMPRLREETGSSKIRTTLLQELTDLDKIMAEEMEIDEESELSKKIRRLPNGKRNQGGQNLVRLLHAKHRLGNSAELEQVPFNRNVLWTEFKNHPDHFVIVQGTEGVAGIRPSEEYIDFMTRQFARAGKEYNPAGDSRLQYQVVAFKNDGEKLDSSLFQDPEPEPEKEKKTKKKGGEDEKFISSDPTVIRTRMGMVYGKDTQVPFNVFNLLADEIGELKHVWVSGFWGLRKDKEIPRDVQDRPGSVEREKMAARKEMNRPLTTDEAVQKIFDRFRPRIKEILVQAKSQVMRSIPRYVEGGNFDGAKKAAERGAKIENFLIAIDRGAINFAAGDTPVLKTVMANSISQASNAQPGSPQYDKYVQDALQGGTTDLFPVFKAMKANLTR